MLTEKASQKDAAGKHLGSVPTNSDGFKSWADRECAKWPGWLQAKAYSAWAFWDKPGFYDDFAESYRIFMNGQAND